MKRAPSSPLVGWLYLGLVAGASGATGTIASEHWQLALATGALGGTISFFTNRFSSWIDQTKARARPTPKETGPNGHLIRLSGYTLRSLIERYATHELSEPALKTAVKKTACHAEQRWIE